MSYMKIFSESPLSKEEIKAKIQSIAQTGGWAQLKRDIMRYNKMRDEIIEEMENQTDPIYLRFLNIYKSTMTAQEFEQNRLKIYAICNKHAMYACLPVDELLRRANKRRRRH